MGMIFSEDNRVEVPYGLFGKASGRKKGHGGLDIDTVGDPTIHSTVNGRVKWSRCVKQGTAGWGNTWEWGWFVWIVADDGTDHIFAHCKAYSLQVKEGQRVQAGQALATMGKTGNAAYDKQAEHVHYEVRRGGVAIDPTPWCGIPNRVGTTMNGEQTGTAGNNTEKQEDGNVKMGIYQRNKEKAVSSALLKEGAFALMNKDGSIDLFQRRMAREVTDKTLSSTFDAMKGEMQQGEIIAVTED